MAFVTHQDSGKQNGVRGRIIGLPFLGELWGEVGGEESWEEALDTVSSSCLRCLSFPSSDKDRIFFRDWGELVPVDMYETSRISIRNAAIPWGWGSKLHCLGFFGICSCRIASRWQQCCKYLLCYCLQIAGRDTAGKAVMACQRTGEQGRLLFTGLYFS